MRVRLPGHDPVWDSEIEAVLAANGNSSWVRRMGNEMHVAGLNPRWDFKVCFWVWRVRLDVVLEYVR